MRVLQFGKFFPPDFGGIESVMRNLTIGLNALGVSSDVLCASSRNRTEVSEEGGFRVIRTASFGRAFSTALSPALILWLFRIHRQYDVIHVHMPDPLAVIALLLCRPKAKLILHWHADVDFARFRWVRRLYQPFADRLVRRADVVVGATAAHIRHSPSTPLFEHKSEVIPYPLERTFDGQPRPTDRPDILAMTQGRFVVFAVGRLIYYKGFEYLVEAAKDLPEDCLVIIAGTGPLESALRERIGQLGVHDRVKLVGRVSEDELLAYYSLCNVFCFPSIYRGEMFGMVQIEAMSFGKPVVSTDIPLSGVTEVNLHGVTGIVVPVMQAQALAKAIVELKADPVRYAQMSLAARARARDVYSPRAVIPRYVRLYEGLLGADAQALAVGESGH
jgi:glycosyltransferase involved in cell wall biosynthesis